MSAEIAVSVLPAVVYREETNETAVLHFDLQLANATDTSLILRAIDYRGLDAHDAIVLRRTVDEHGLRPGIEVIPDRVVPAGGVSTVFNPLYAFSSSLGVSRLQLRCQFTAEDGRILEAEADVCPVSYLPRAALSLPLAGRVLVSGGHDFLSPHRRIDPTHPIAVQFGVRANSGRYADDLSLVDAAGNLFSGDGGRLSDWLGFGAPVRAPASGTVVSAVASVADNELAHGGVEFAALPDDPAAAIFGNHVIIDHGNDEHSVLGHLQYESVAVALGDRVAARQPIARVGLSGNTDFVHLHYQLQAGPDPRLAEGLPTRFADIGPLEPGIIAMSS